MTKDEALKLALEALEKAYWPTEPNLMPAHNIKECAEAITAIKEALAQPKQKPVAWRYTLVVEGQEIRVRYDEVSWNPKFEPFGRYGVEHGGEVTKLPVYTTPPQSKPLTAQRSKT
jgi:hypothetical protein